MKAIPIFCETNILFTVIFQAAVFHSKSLDVNPKKLFYHDQLLIKRISNFSVWNKSEELTENVNPTNIFEANDIGKRNYINNSGL